MIVFEIIFGKAVIVNIVCRPENVARLSGLISLFLVAQSGTRNIQQTMSEDAAGVSDMTLMFGDER